MWRDDELIRDGNLQYNTLIYSRRRLQLPTAVLYIS
jgi:hypothetical protein